MSIVNSIPASQIVDVQPNVLSAGGTALQIIALVLTTSNRVPTGAVQSFATTADVAAFFGASSNEAAIAQVYFNGYVGASVSPEAILFAQYNTAAVSAYLRGGNVSSLTLAQLQALSGTLAVVMDGYAHVASGIVLTSASSFSAAAGLIQTAFAANVITTASLTAAIGATATGTGSSINLTLSAVTGFVTPGDLISGTGVPIGTTIISQTSGTTGGAGVYVTSGATTATSAAIVVKSNTVIASAVASGALAAGQILVGAGVTVGTQIASLGTSTGGVGTFLIAGAQQQVASQSMTTTAPPVLVTYDSVSGAFILSSSITGVPSTAAYATAGTIANALQLTLVLGATISQGVAAATPNAYMTNITQVTQNFVTFMTAFNPDSSGNANKLAFALWTSQQNDQYAYVCWDSDITATTTVPATTSLGYLLTQGNYSGTFLIYEPAGVNLYHAAFVCGTVASINFSQKNGRITLKFRTGSGIVPGVTNATVAENLAANGYNFYGAYATRNQNFQFLANGVVSGPFKWMDTYINQIWLNNELQLAILTGLTSVGSVPYNSAGNALIEAFCADPINQALNFGAIRTNVTLSAAQATEVNQSAGGTNIAPNLQTRGWYLQVLNADAQTRANRGSPPCTLWYMDGGSVQKIDLDSIEVQ